MAEIFEYVFDGATGIRIVTMPNETIKREEVVIQLRVATGPETRKIVRCALTDPKTQEDIYPLLEDAILQVYLKREGKQCENCERFYLPSSPNQKQCLKCKDGS